MGPSEASATLPGIPPWVTLGATSVLSSYGSEAQHGSPSGGVERPRARILTMRLSGRTLVILGAVLGLVVVSSTDQIVPATTPYQAQMRIWMVARAAGITAYLILTFIVAVGLILSHPVNKSTWKLS